MKNYITLFIAVFMCSLTLAQVDRSKMPEPGPAPSINLGTPYEFQLKNGLNVLIVENHKLPRVRASLTIDNKPMSFGEKIGTESMLGAMLGNGTQKRSKDAFNERIDFLGASVFFSASGAYASSLSKYFEEILGLMAEGALMPKFTAEEFEKEQQKMLDGLKSEEKSQDQAAGRVRRLIDYGAGHPYAEYATQASVKDLTLEDIKQHYNKYFAPNNAYLVIVGDVNPKKTKKLVKKLFKNWDANDNLQFPDLPSVPAIDATSIRLTDFPSASQSFLNVSYPVEITKNHPDFFPVLIASKILGGNFNSRLNMNLREANGWTYGARGGVRDDRYIGRFYASAKVRNEVTDSAVVETMKEIKLMANTPVTQEEIENAKAKFVGDFVLSLEQPSTVADFALNIKTQKLDKDFYKNYLKNIKNVTIEDVQRVSKKYFTPEKANIHITGKTEAILAPLQKLGYPIHFYNKWGEKIENPTKTQAADVDGMTVINNYLKAIGGKEKAAKLNSISMDFNLTGMAPMPLQGTFEFMNPNLEKAAMNFQGMEVKMIFDGEKQIVNRMGQIQETPGDKVPEKLNKKGYIDQLYYTADQLKVAMAKLDDQEVYKVSVDTNGTTVTEYYDAASGLLVQSESTQETPQGPLTSTTKFSDYQEVEGIKIPMKVSIQTGPQNMNFTYSNVKINPELSAENFK